MNVTWRILHDTIAKCWHWDCCTIVITSSHISECSVTKRFRFRGHLHIWSSVNYAVAWSRTRIAVEPVGFHFWSAKRHLYIIKLRCIDFFEFSLRVILIFLILRPYGVVSKSIQGHFWLILKFFDKVNSSLKDDRHCLRILLSLEHQKFQIPSFWPLDLSWSTCVSMHHLERSSNFDVFLKCLGKYRMTHHSKRPIRRRTVSQTCRW